MPGRGCALQRRVYMLVPVLQSLGRIARTALGSTGNVNLLSVLR